MAPAAPIAAWRPPGTRATHIAQQLGDTLASDNTLLLLDLEPITSVEVATVLNARGLAHVVLVLPRWPYVDAVLPTAALTRVLLDQSGHLTDDVPTNNVAFVLDAERSAPIRRKSAASADNRYRLNAADLPNLKALREHSIQHVVKVS